MRTYPIAQGTLFYIPWRYEWKGNPKRRGYMCVHMADSVCCTVETNTREGNGTPLQYSCLENPMDGGAWWATVHGVAKSWTWLGFTFTFHFHALEKEMATHSGVLAWRIPGTGEPGGLPSMRSHRVGHNWSDLAAAAACNYIIVSDNGNELIPMPLMAVSGIFSRG